MRFVLILLLVTFGCMPAALWAQDKKIPIAEIKQTRIGFISNDPADGHGRYKVGMWTPVYLLIKAGPQGIHPKGPNEPHPYIQVENEDAEQVGTIYRTPFVMDANEERWVMTYAKPGQMSDIKIKVVIGDLEIKPMVQWHGALDLNTHLYVSLGERIVDLNEALRGLAGKGKQPNFNQPGERDTGPRYAGFETDIGNLPEHWFGYHSVDLLFLSTRDKEFLLQLAKDNDVSRARLKAIAQYVRRGGRLVIGVSPRNADVLAQVLQSTVWQPAIPVVPPKEGTVEVPRLIGMENFARAHDQRFTGAAGNPLKVAVLQPAKMVPGAWEVLESTTDPNQGGKPLIARIPYGLGSITLVGIALDELPFTTWGGRSKFLQELVSRIGPRVSNAGPEQPGQRGVLDLTTDLQKSLENFDVRVIPFGYVALFIVLYILIVGPLDFLVLKYVFKRLEWTWFTFPTVVLAVSVAAYFTAYAIKGNDLKINKVDLIDFDLRTSVDAKGQPTKVSAYGQTFFTILSPRIQNYTIGVEPNPLFWGQQAADKAASADMVTWLGRPETDMFGGMQRGGGQGFFRKPYRYEADAVGLRDVPIPVWTTKSFQAAYEVPNIAAPIQTDLTYHSRPEQGKELALTGTLKSGLAVDLDDVWLFYLDSAYPIEGGLPKGGELKIHVEQGQKKTISEWATASARDGTRLMTAQGGYNPSPLVRQIQFNERLDAGNTSRNHALRPLDLSWRLREDPRNPRDIRIREAILVARVKFAVGDANSLNSDDSPLIPTKLWLGALPGDGGKRPALAGTLAQDTFVRILLPVKPKE